MFAPGETSSVHTYPWKISNTSLPGQEQLSKEDIKVNNNHSSPSTQPRYALDRIKWNIMKPFLTIIIWLLQAGEVQATQTVHSAIAGSILLYLCMLALFAFVLFCSILSCPVWPLTNVYFSRYSSLRRWLCQEVPLNKSTRFVDDWFAWLHPVMVRLGWTAYILLALGQWESWHNVLVFVHCCFFCSGYWI